MLTRRALGMICGCMLHQGLSSSARGQSLDWICSTTDTAGTDPSTAIDEYSSNVGVDAARIGQSLENDGITPYGTAMLKNRWLRKDGLTPNSGKITLGVYFLNGSEDQKALVKSTANLWTETSVGQFIQFAFDVPRARSQIVINVLSDRNNCIVGRRGQEYVKYQATMNLKDLGPYVILHEFGHALGLEHEHQNPTNPIKWNKRRVEADMAKQGWSKEDCEREIFSIFGKEGCTTNPEFDGKSIMVYPISSDWTLDGSYFINYELSKGDQQCIVGLYRP